MIANTLFCSLNSAKIAHLIETADQSVCYAGPGLQIEPAKAMAKVAGRLGPEMVSVSLDFEERVLRMGYGDLEAIDCVRRANIVVSHAPGLRNGLVIVDNTGYAFTPTPHYLEAEPIAETALNALRLSADQVAEARARLSPAAKAIAMAMASTEEEKKQIVALPVELNSAPVKDQDFEQVAKSLKEAPPVKFDLARQVRVFEPYLQYVEMNLTGASIQRHRLQVPRNIQKIGVGKDLEGRLRTTIELIERQSSLSSKVLEDELNEIRKNFTPSLGKEHGRVVLKSAKKHLIKRLDAFRERLEDHKKTVKDELQKHLAASRQQIVNYYVPIVVKTPPDNLLGQLMGNADLDKKADTWLNRELDQVFPKAESLIKEMKLEVRFKDVTFETLNRDDFLGSVKNAFPYVDWDKAYNEFKAAGETNGGQEADSSYPTKTPETRK